MIKPKSKTCAAGFRKDPLAASMDAFKHALISEAKKSPDGKLHNRKDFLAFYAGLLDSYYDGEAFALDGGVRTNNAATALPLVGAVKGAVKARLDYTAYGGRKDAGKAIASRSGSDENTLSFTEKVNRYRKLIEDFVGIDPGKDTLLFGLNTSDVIGKLALLCNYSSSDIVLVPQMEHTSNHLPWRQCGATVKTISQNPDGSIDLGDLKAKLAECRGRVRMVAFTGASNITGIRPGIDEIASLAHAYGALVAVDCAQLAPHFPMLKKAWGADFVAFSAHKLGASGGPGVLAAPLKFLEERLPVIPGGGTVDDILVGADGKITPVWARKEGKHQPGSWNTTGICELGAAVGTILNDIGWERIITSEHTLFKYAFTKFKEIPGFTPLLDAPALYEKGFLTPVISFNLEGYTPQELLDALAAKGIQARGGDNDPICNHEYIRNVRGLTGIVRVSFTFHNTPADIDAIASVLRELRAKRPL